MVSTTPLPPFLSSFALLSRPGDRRTNIMFSKILQDCVTYVEYRQAKTVTIYDVSLFYPLSSQDYLYEDLSTRREIFSIMLTQCQVIHALKRIGRPIYGFDDPELIKSRKTTRRAIGNGNVADED